MLSHGATPGPGRSASPGLGGGRSILASALPYLLPLAGALAASASGIESSGVLVAVTASAVACALVRVAVELTRVETARDSADRWIGARTGRPPSDDVLLARIDELLSGRTRTSLARAFRRVAADAAGAGRPWAAAQLNRRRLRRHVDDLQRIADRLEDLSVPVTPRGVALAHRLVTAGGGPLYNSRYADMLPTSLGAVLYALDDAAQPVPGR